MEEAHAALNDRPSADMYSGDATASGTAIGAVERVGDGVDVGEFEEDAGALLGLMLLLLVASGVPLPLLPALVVLVGVCVADGIPLPLGVLVEDTFTGTKRVALRLRCTTMRGRAAPPSRSPAASAGVHPFAKHCVDLTTSMRRGPEGPHTLSQLLGAPKSMLTMPRVLDRCRCMLLPSADVTAPELGFVAHITFCARPGVMMASFGSLVLRARRQVMLIWPPPSILMDEDRKVTSCCASRRGVDRPPTL